MMSAHVGLGMGGIHFTSRADASANNPGKRCGQTSSHRRLCAIASMVRKRVGCVPIVDHDGCPIGMVTKQDLLEFVIAARDPDAATPLVTQQLMMPLAFTLDEHATIAHAAAMMAVEGVHHVPIVAESGCLIGVVSTLDIVRWLAANDGLFIAPAGG